VQRVEITRPAPRRVIACLLLEREQRGVGIDSPPRPVVTEHRYHTVACPDCGTSITADRPASVPDGAFGPEVSSLVGLLSLYTAAGPSVVEFAGSCPDAVRRPSLKTARPNGGDPSR
jgi:hypothetical protein